MSNEKNRVKLVMEVNNKDYDIVTTVTDDIIHNALGYIPMNKDLKGAVEGVAELDDNGTVPSTQLPSFVDDIINGYLKIQLINNNSILTFYEDEMYTKKIEPESGKIYVNISDNKTYRWSGTNYIVISETLAIGETSSTAYRGDRGKIAYDHSQIFHAPIDAEKNQNAFSNIKVNNEVISSTKTSDTIEFASSGNIDLKLETISDVKRLTISSEKYVLSAAGTELGGVKSGGDVNIDNGIITVKDGTHKHDIENINNLQSELNKKLSTSTKYAASSVIGGSAISAVKLDTNAGAENIPVYFSGGKPQACEYELNKSVPSDASFEPNTWRGIQNNLTSDSTEDSLSAKQGKLLNEKITSLKYAASSVIGGSALMAEKAQQLVRENSGDIELLEMGSDDKPVYFYDGIPTECKTMFAGGSSHGGPANYARFLGHYTASGFVNTSEGAENKPVYFSNGTPVACTYELNTDVPENAIFSNFKGVNMSSSSTKGSAGYVPAPTSSNRNMFLSSDGSWKKVDIIDQNCMSASQSNAKEWPLLISEEQHLGTNGSLIDAVSKSVNIDDNSNLMSFNPYYKRLTIGDGTTTGVVKASSFEGNLTGTASNAELATSCTKLVRSSNASVNISVGSDSSPVYFKDGIPVFCNFTAGCRGQSAINIKGSGSSRYISASQTLFTSCSILVLFIQVNGEDIWSTVLIPLNLLYNTGKAMGTGATVHMSFGRFITRYEEDNKLFIATGVQNAPDIKNINGFVLY